MPVSSPSSSVASRAPANRYGVPALEKGLDILELLAGEAEGMTQAHIARRLGRSSSEIFRMLTCLQRRGYVRRSAPAETYHLATRLFELAHRHPPTKGLLEAALPAMRRLALDVRQSCHLAVLHDTDVLVIAQADGPEPRGLCVRLGARFPVPQTASGLVLLAYAAAAAREPLLRESGLPGAGPAEGPAGLSARLEAIRRRGGERARSTSIHGVIDLSCPVLDHAATAVAALTVPYLVQRGRPPEIDAAQGRLAAAAADVSRALGGGGREEHQSREDPDGRP